MASDTDFSIVVDSGEKIGYRWDETAPVDFLYLLRDYPQQFVMVGAAPRGWMTDRDVLQIGAQIESTLPAARACSVLPAPPVEGGPASTVGQEAMKLLRAYRRGLGYMPNCTAWQRIGDAEVQEMRAWLTSRYSPPATRASSSVSGGLLDAFARWVMRKPVDYAFAGPMTFEYAQLQRDGNRKVTVPVTFAGGQWKENSGMAPYAINVQRSEESNLIFTDAVEITVIASLPAKGRTAPLLMEIEDTFSATPIRLIYRDPDGTRHAIGTLYVPKGRTQ